MDRDEGGGQTAKGGEEEPGRAVSAELVVYDKHSRCLLTEGDYELVRTSTSLSEILEVENDEHSGPYDENYETSGLPGLPGAGLSITPATLPSLSTSPAPSSS